MRWVVKHIDIDILDEPADVPVCSSSHCLH
jgi:hypothetical protein